MIDTMCEATVLAELPMSGFYSGCAWGCCLKGIAIALTSLVFLCIWVRFREVQASKEVYTFMKYCQWPCCAKMCSLLLGFLAGTEILMAEGRPLENQVILGGGRHCSVWGHICKYVWGRAHCPRMWENNSYFCIFSTCWNGGIGSHFTDFM